jgi:hypothetical protein
MLSMRVIPAIAATAPLREQVWMISVDPVSMLATTTPAPL